MIDYRKYQPIGELYTCLQGEGKYMGVPHILIRVTGCRLRCQFANSFCDTPYASWKPEKGKHTLDDVMEIYKSNPQIKHTMITGGGPTLHRELLKELCKIGKFYKHNVTIETEGSEFVQTMADCISLSPKLSNSTPRPGTWMDYANREVTESDKKKHEKWRKNYKAMKELIDNHPDYQLKPVISNIEELEEVRQLQNILDIPNDKVWLMELCAELGYNFADRLHIIAYGDTRGV